MHPKNIEDLIKDPALFCEKRLVRDLRIDDYEFDGKSFEDVKTYLRNQEFKEIMEEFETIENDTLHGWRLFNEYEHGKLSNYESVYNGFYRVIQHFIYKVIRKGFSLEDFPQDIIYRLMKMDLNVYIGSLKHFRSNVAELGLEEQLDRNYKIAKEDKNKFDACIHSGKFILRSYSIFLECADRRLSSYEKILDQSQDIKEYVKSHGKLDEIKIFRRELNFYFEIYKDALREYENFYKVKLDELED